MAESMCWSVDMYQGSQIRPTADGAGRRARSVSVGPDSSEGFDDTFKNGLEMTGND